MKLPNINFTPEKEKELGALARTAHKLIYDAPAQQDVVQTKDAMLEEFMENLDKCVQAGKKRIFNKDFYIVCSPKKDPIFPNIMKNLWWYRASCPTPQTDNMVWKYHHKDDGLEELWVIPDRETVQMYKDNALDVHPDERQMLNYILDYSDGTLLKKCKRLNHETDDTAQLIIHNE